MIEMNYEDIVSNVKVYGMEDAMKGSKYSFAVDLQDVNADITPTIRRLASSGLGEGHDNFLNGVIVQFDLTFSNKAWVEAERYHFLDFVSSQSTMHRITKFNLDETFMPYTNKEMIAILKKMVEEYNVMKAENMVDPRLTEKYLEILYSTPSGLRITAKMTTNYRQLKTIYVQRKNHKLPEWRAFCRWIETLPESELITGKRNPGV